MPRTTKKTAAQKKAARAKRARDSLTKRGRFECERGCSEAFPTIAKRAGHYRSTHPGSGPIGRVKATRRGGHGGGDPDTPAGQLRISKGELRRREKLAAKPAAFCSGCGLPRSGVDPYCGHCGKEF